MMPQTLKVTQVAVEVLRQTASLSDRQDRKKIPQRTGQLAPALFVQIEGLGENIFDEQSVEAQSTQQAWRRRRHRGRSASS